jgi:hypothetical protein
LGIIDQPGVIHFAGAEAATILIKRKFKFRTWSNLITKAWPGIRWADRSSGRDHFSAWFKTKDSTPPSRAK